MVPLRLLLPAALLWAASVQSAARAQTTALAVPLGPERGWIQAITLSPEFSSDRLAWVSAFGGHIFASQDGGTSWHVSDHGETDPVVTGVTVSPSFGADHTVFAAADEGVFRSEDSGVTWTNMSTGLSGRAIRQVALSPSFSSDHQAFAATDGGVFRSSDGSASWQPPSDHEVAVTVLGVLPQTPGTPLRLLAGPAAGGLLESFDGGAHWLPVIDFPPDRQVLSLAISPDFLLDHTVLVGTNDGLWETTASDSGWSELGL